MNQTRPMKIFAPASSREYAEKVATILGMPLTPLEEKFFDDGEYFLLSSRWP